MRSWEGLVGWNTRIHRVNVTDIQSMGLARQTPALFAMAGTLPLVHRVESRFFEFDELTAPEPVVFERCLSFGSANPGLLSPFPLEIRTSRLLLDDLQLFIAASGLDKGVDDYHLGPLFDGELPSLQWFLTQLGPLLDCHVARLRFFHLTNEFLVFLLVAEEVDLRCKRECTLKEFIRVDIYKCMWYLIEIRVDWPILCRDSCSDHLAARRS